MPTTSLRQVESLRFRSNKNPQDSLYQEDPRRKNARDNRLWLLSFLGILIVSSILVWQLGKIDTAIERKAIRGTDTQRLPEFPGMRHRAVAEEIRANITSLGVHECWVRFTGEQQLEVELPTDMDRERVSSILGQVKQIANSRLDKRPGIALYFAKTPGIGPRTLASVEGINPAD